MTRVLQWSARILAAILMLALVATVFSPRGKADGLISDLFDDGSIDAKWTTLDYGGQDGTVTETGGNLVMTVSANPASDSLPVAMQAAGIGSQTFDLRAEVTLASAPTSGQTISFGIMGPGPDPSKMCHVQIREGSSHIYIERYDSTCGAGSSTQVDGVLHFYLRITGNGDTTFTAYYSTSPGTWIELPAGATPYTSSSASNCILLMVHQMNHWDAEANSIAWNWMVSDAEYSGWPAAPTTTTTTSPTTTTTLSDFYWREIINQN